MNASGKGGGLKEGDESMEDDSIEDIEERGEREDNGKEKERRTS